VLELAWLPDKVMLLEKGTVGCDDIVCEIDLVWSTVSSLDWDGVALVVDTGNDTVAVKVSLFEMECVTGLQSAPYRVIRSTTDNTTWHRAKRSLNIWWWCASRMNRKVVPLVS